MQSCCCSRVMLGMMPFAIENRPNFILLSGCVLVLNSVPAQTLFTTLQHAAAAALIRFVLQVVQDVPNIVSG